MRAVVIREPGGPEVLEPRELRDPEPSYGHVRVAVSFAGVNRADLLQRMGRYPAPAGVPADIPGLEYAGTVDAVGAGVTSWSIGDRVFGLLAGGGYADRVVAHEREVVRVPESLDLEQAAAVPEAFVTAYDALVVRGRARPGEVVLVHAAGSGVGTAAIQLARALGCRVIGTSRTPQKLERCRSLGLDAAVVTGGADWVDAVRKEGPVDVVVDLVGGAYVSKNTSVCAQRGRIVLVGLTGGTRTELDLSAVLRRRLEIIGTVLRSRPLEEKIAAAQLLAGPICAWIERGAVAPVVDATLSWREASIAHARLHQDRTFGKLLLRFCGD